MKPACISFGAAAVVVRDVLWLCFEIAYLPAYRLLLWVMQGQGYFVPFPLYATEYAVFCVAEVVA
jgi:hypothetical protein